MYKKDIYQISANDKIAKNVYRMVLAGETKYFTKPGQFLNIALEGKYLRRPISICDIGEQSVTIIYKVVGAGTRQMSAMKPGEKLDILTGLGNGFDVEKGGCKPLLVGGGVGVPPLFYLAKQLLAAGQQPVVVLGFNTVDEVFYQTEFEAIGCQTFLATADGSAGEKGFVTDVLQTHRIEYDYFYACGPFPMLRALAETTHCSGQLSFEERMGCGFGACVGCSCKTKYGSKRICVDGPVLEKEEIIW